MTTDSNRLLLVVFDESGGNNRPGLSHEDDFCLAGIVFPTTSKEALAAASRELGLLVQAKDYKYRHVQKSAAGRIHFLRILNSSLDAQVFAFYAGGGSLKRENERTLGAGLHYGSNLTSSLKAYRELQDNPRKYSLVSFVQYAAPCLASFCIQQAYTMDMWWDSRTDMDLIESIWRDHLVELDKPGPLRGASKVSTFRGATSKDLNPICRLAGVLAGDIALFFRKYGPRVWSHLRSDGLRYKEDPIVGMDFPKTYLAATIRESIADPYPRTPDPNTCMLRGYTKRILSGLVPFGDPDGRMGFVAIDHGSLWRIIQCPD